MNTTPVIFNRDVFGGYISSFSPEGVAGYQDKYGEMQKWKKSTEKGRFHRTKETSVQSAFLSSIFGRVLGYAEIVEQDEWNQSPELKSVLDSTEADCGLGFFTSDSKIVRAVVELKDADTNLDRKQNRTNHLTPVEQAFSYAHKNGSGCGWVIVSNFVEVRLYKSTSSLEYEQFFITDLDDEDEFKRFYFLLCKDNLIAKEGKSVVDRLYEDNEKTRAEISNQFYNDYKSLRTDLFEALKGNNSSIDELILFSKAQKILDRFIFVCFCENRRLLPQGIFADAIEAAKISLMPKPNLLWEQMRGLFYSIDQGNPRRSINGYNGGLFKHDEILDNLVVPDDVLENFERLTAYDFGSDLNVNILGHIFEQSITDLEIVKAEIEGVELDRTNGKRKSDGIYYTPDYVTNFIVKKTIGRWLDDEKEKIKKELIGEEGFTAVVTIGKSRRKTIVLKHFEEMEENGDEQHYDAVVKLHVAFWEKYIDRMKQIKVLDPACGSGAFLNCAFDYLHMEGADAVEMYNSLLEGQMTLFDWDTHILQNNLYGVDLNSESVEITKLSLWLKTADNKKPLVFLDDNIKIGNSIISDPEVVGSKAFDWYREYPAIMEQGGFDVVLGNPPYGANLNQSEKDYLATNYITTEYNFDTYKTFIELGINLIKQNGYMGYITPNTFFVLEKGGSRLRKFLFEGCTLLDIVELFNVFPAAVVEPAITVFRKAVPDEREVLEVVAVPRRTDFTGPFTIDGVRTSFVQGELRERKGYIFNYRATEDEKTLRRKIDNFSKPLSECFLVSNGIKPYEKGKGSPPQTGEIVINKPFEGYEKLDENWMPYVKGKTFQRYTDRWDGEYIKYGEWLAAPRDPKIFKKEKLFVRQTGDHPISNYDFSGKICKNSVHIVHSLESRESEESGILLKYVLGLINSRLMKWIYQYDNFQEVGKTLAEVKKAHVERLPIVFADDQQPVITLVNSLLETCQRRFDNSKSFLDYIKAIYNPKKISERLASFYTLDFGEFIAELKKQKANLTEKQAMDLMPLFKEKSQEIADITEEITKLDNALDNLVFQIYGLTEEDIHTISAN